MIGNISVRVMEFVGLCMVIFRENWNGIEIILLML